MCPVLMMMQIAPVELSGRVPDGQPLAGLLREPEKLDPSFFGLSEGEVGSLDPHDRMLLHLTAHALHRANLLDREWEGLRGRRVGVFMGLSNGEWGQGRGEGARGKASDLISQCFHLSGPSITVNSGCASAMSALEMGVQSLVLRRCEVAIVGAAHLLLSPRTHEGRALAGRLIAGRSYRLSEGGGVLVLQRVRGAGGEGRHVMALVRGLGTAFVGKQGKGQEALVRQVREEAGVDKEGGVAYVEMSGTGAEEEDGEEGRWLARLYQPPLSPSPSVANGKGRLYPPPGASTGKGKGEGVVFVGCGKAVLGHMDAACGMLGLCKALLVLHKQAIPPQTVGLEGLEAILSSQGEGEGLRALVARAPTPVEGNKGPVMVAVHCVAWGGVAGHAILGQYTGNQTPRPIPQPLPRAGPSSAAVTSDKASSDKAPQGNGKGRKKAKAGRAVVVVEEEGGEEEESQGTGGPAEKPQGKEAKGKGSSSKGGGSKDKQGVVVRRSISWEEALVFPRLAAYQWWYQQPAPVAEEEEQEEVTLNKDG